MCKGPQVLGAWYVQGQDQEHTEGGGETGTGGGDLGSQGSNLRAVEASGRFEAGV